MAIGAMRGSFMPMGIMPAPEVIMPAPEQYIYARMYVYIYIYI
jgi:hypothetical protein